MSLRTRPDPSELPREGRQLRPDRPVIPAPQARMVMEGSQPRLPPRRIHQAARAFCHARSPRIPRSCLLHRHQGSQVTSRVRAPQDPWPSRPLPSPLCSVRSGHLAASPALAACLEGSRRTYIERTGSPAGLAPLSSAWHGATSPFSPTRRVGWGGLVMGSPELLYSLFAGAWKSLPMRPGYQPDSAEKMPECVFP